MPNHNLHPLTACSRDLALSGAAGKTTFHVILMRVLLRDSDTGLYFRQPKQWTNEADKAQAFRHSAEAMNHARAARVENAEVILTFDDPNYVVALPLPKMLDAIEESGVCAVSDL